MEYSLAKVLEWKYGCVAGTRQINPNDISPFPEMFISGWNHPTIPKPDEVQIAIDTAEYEVYITSQQAVDDKKEVRFNSKEVTVAVALAIMDYLNESRSLQSLPPITNQELKTKVKSYLP